MTSLKDLIDSLVYIQDGLDPDVREEATVLVGLESRYNYVLSEVEENTLVSYNNSTNQIVITSRIAEDAHMFISFDKEEEDVPIQK